MPVRSVFSGDLIIKVHSFVTGPFQENTYLIVNEDQKAGIFIDPGDEPERLIQFAREHQVKPAAIINTHGHLDHTGAVSALKQEFGIPFYLHNNESAILASSEASYALFGLPVQSAPAVDYWLSDDKPVLVGNMEIRIILTPGHTPGGVCLKTANHVFVGDTLFRGSVGRTDLPGGNWDQLEASLVKLLQTISDDDIIHCGHGPDTDRITEMHSNPFISNLKDRISGNN